MHLSLCSTFTSDGTLTERSSLEPSRFGADRVEASPSPVYGAALLMRFGPQAHREFKSRRLRQFDLAIE